MIYTKTAFVTDCRLFFCAALPYDIVVFAADEIPPMRRIGPLPYDAGWNKTAFCTVFYPVFCTDLRAIKVEIAPALLYNILVNTAQNKRIEDQK